MSDNKNKNDNSKKRMKMIGGAAAVVVIALLIIWMKVVQGGQAPAEEMLTFTAKKGPLTISVLESGTIKSREQIIIKNEVEGRTSILSLIAEGTRVKKGDLLVELDASSLEDSRIDQEIKVQNAEAAYINAKENLVVVENQAEADVNVAELTLEFAKEDLRLYEEQFRYDLTAAGNQIQLAQEELKRAEDTNDWSEKLLKEKYISETEAQADRLAVTRARNALELAESDKDMLEKHTYNRQIKQLESDVYQAEMALKRARAKQTADVVQAKADRDAKKAEFDRQTAKLEKLKDQIDKATIYAPADGMVIYATTARRGGWRDNREPLDEGVEVFERQELIYLPTAASAMAEVDIHEASLDKVELGLPAIITVDALPGKKFLGAVARISPLPDPQSMWMNPDLKVYQSDIHLEGDDPSLRTGMSCKAEIIAAQYKDVIYVPVQSVIRVDGKPTVYVLHDDRIEARPVEIGMDNNRMIHVVNGLEEGEVVMMTPPLRSAAINTAGVEGIEQSDQSDGEGDSLRDTINKRLEAVNGAGGSQAGPDGAERAGPNGEPRGSRTRPPGGQGGNRPRPSGRSQ